MAKKPGKKPHRPKVARKPKRPPWHDENFYRALSPEAKKMYDETDWDYEEKHSWLDEGATYVVMAPRKKVRPSP